MIRVLPLPVVRYLWRFFIVGVGALHTWVAILQQSIGADGINYLEIGEAFWRGDWGMALNGIWSPLYGIIAGGVITLVSPEVRWVFPTVQIVNFFIFLGSLAGFELFWGELRRNYLSRQGESEGIRIEGGLWYSLGYALFLWSALNLIEIWSVTPDMLVSASVYFGAGFTLRVIREGGRWASFGMGLALGLGYLAKAPMFPLSLVWFVLAGFATGNVSTGLRRLAPGFLAFSLIAGPFVGILSLEQGHPTFSEVSRFTYLKHVNRIPYPRWRAENAVGLGTPLNPPVLANSSPELFIYSSPIRGSYPPSFDPDYFTEGLKPRISFREQGTAFVFNMAFYFRLFFRTQGLMVGVAVLMILFFPRELRFHASRGGDWPLALWALACFAMYSLVFVAERYVGPFVVLFWAGFLSYWRLGKNELAGKLSRAAGGVMVLSLLVNVVALNLEGLVSIVGLNPPVEAPTSQFSGGPSASPPAVAEALREAGVEDGTDIGLIGYGFTAFWAYLADVRIVSEISPEEAHEFWQADDETRNSVLSAFLASGARYIVAEVPPVDPGKTEGWKALGETGYWLLQLPQS